MKNPILIVFIRSIILIVAMALAMYVIYHLSELLFNTIN